MSNVYQISLRIDGELRQRLEAYAREMDRPVAWVIRLAVSEFLAEREASAEEGAS